jgi:hypothetical protein
VEYQILQIFEETRLTGGLVREKYDNEHESYDKDLCIVFLNFKLCTASDQSIFPFYWE